MYHLKHLLKNPGVRVLRMMIEEDRLPCLNLAIDESAIVCRHLLFAEPLAPEASDADRMNRDLKCGNEPRREVRNRREIVIIVRKFRRVDKLELFDRLCQALAPEAIGRRVARGAQTRRFKCPDGLP